MKRHLHRETAINSSTPKVVISAQLPISKKKKKLRIYCDNQRSNHFCFRSQLMILTK